MRMPAYNAGAILEISALADTGLLDTIERAKAAGIGGQMFDVGEIQARIETLNSALRMTPGELELEIAAHEIHIAPRVLDRVKRSLSKPRAPYQLTDLTLAAMGRHFLEGPSRELRVDRVPEATVFFWVRRNSGRLVNHSEIGAELELPASAVSSAVRHLLEEGLVGSQHEPRDLTRYRYRALDFQGALKLVWPEKDPISARDV